MHAVERFDPILIDDDQPATPGMQVGPPGKGLLHHCALAGNGFRHDLRRPILGARRPLRGAL